MEADAAETKANIEKERNREKELTAEYYKENNSLNQKLGGKKQKLDEVLQARKEFEAMGIEDKLKLASREDTIKKEAGNKQA